VKKWWGWFSKILQVWTEVVVVVVAAGEPVGSAGDG
jgi:hypothetical protein